MNTKYDIGDKVVLKAMVDGIIATKNGVVYQLTIFDGESGYNNRISIKEPMLIRMDKNENDR